MILFFGLAGSGKSVQSEILAEKLGWQHLSVGALLRQYKSVEGLDDHLKTGQLVKPELANFLVKKYLDELGSARVIMDGYPRQMEQATWLIDELKSYSIEVAVLIKVSEDKIRRRLASRKRADDTPEAITQRVEIFEQETKPVMSYLQSQGIRFIEIDGEHSIEEVAAEVERAVREALAAN